MKQEIKDRINLVIKRRIPVGFKNIKLGIYPNDWGANSIEDICDIVDYRGKTPTKTEEGVFLLTARNIKEGRIDYEASKEYIPIAEYDNIMSRGIPAKGDVVITTEAPLGNIAQIDYEKIAIAQRVIKLRGHINVINNDYLKYFLLSDNFQGELDKESTGSTVKGIKGARLKKLEVVYPSLLEQEKIASTLSTWDKAIELKENLIEEKKKQKKVLMQKLLTGEVRLPGFNGEWKEVRLGKHGATFNGLSGKTAGDFGTGKPFITYMNVFSNSEINIKQVDYVDIRDNESQFKVQHGDIFFTTSSETPGEVCMSSVLLEQVNEMYLNSFCFGYRLNDLNTILPEFMRFYLRGYFFRKEVYKLAQGSTRFNISKNEVMKLKINVPDIAEQKEIASILTTSDKEISFLVQELEVIKQQKKGLMQLLLTGIVRVNTEN